jgi:hypothetical protein
MSDVKKGEKPRKTPGRVWGWRTEQYWARDSYFARLASAFSSWSSSLMDGRRELRGYGPAYSLTSPRFRFPVCKRRGLY